MESAELLRAIPNLFERMWPHLVRQLLRIPIYAALAYLALLLPLFLVAVPLVMFSSVVADRGVGLTRRYPTAGTRHSTSNQPTWRRFIFGPGYYQRGFTATRPGVFRWVPTSYWAYNGAIDWEFTPVRHTTRGRWLVLENTLGEVGVVQLPPAATAAWAAPPK